MNLNKLEINNFYFVKIVFKFKKNYFFRFNVIKLYILFYNEKLLCYCLM